MNLQQKLHQLQKTNKNINGHYSRGRRNSAKCYLLCHYTEKYKLLQQ